MEMHFGQRQIRRSPFPAQALKSRSAKEKQSGPRAVTSTRRTEPLQLAKDAGFFCKAQWIDQEWPFAENLFVAE